MPLANEVAPHPTRPVLAIAGLQLVTLLAVASRYGFHRDELYFLEAGDRLAWGYVDQPPFTPVIARLSTALLGDSVVAIRVAPAIASACTVVLASLIVRELGGRRWAQIVGAVATAGAGFVLGSGHLLSTAAFDFTAWTAVLWLATRLLRTGRARLWMAIGIACGLALLNKHLVVLLALSLGTGLVIERRWLLLRSRWLVAGVGLAAVIALPNLVWQATNDWPQVEMAQAISERIGGENRALLVPGQLVLLGPLLVPLMIRGARWLARDPSAERYRALVWAWPVALALTFATAGRPYYPLALTHVMVLAGIVATERRADERSETARATRRSRAAALAIANSVIAVPLGLPVLPVSWIAPVSEVNEAAAETVGWPELADQVAANLAELPTAERQRVVILTRSYGEAGALEWFGPSRGLPAPYSGHNSYAVWRRPSDDTAPVLAVRYEPADLAPYFDRCEVVDRVDNGRDVENEVQGTAIVLCRGLRGSWADVWPQLRHYS